MTSKHLLLTSSAKMVGDWLSSFIVGTIVLVGSQSQCAERISFNVSLLEFDVSVQELEDFAKRERIGAGLNPFLSHLGENDRKYVRQFLVFRTDFTPLQVSQFFYSDFGKTLLSFLGELVKPHPELNGSSAIRAGLILAAADREGLSVLNFLKKFPALTMQVDREKGLETVKKINDLRKSTEKVILGIEKKAIALAKSETPIDLKTLPSLAQRGKYEVKIQTETLKDSKRNRQIKVDFYLPKGLTKPVPAIVFSHGLASDRQHFAKLANFLASQGFVGAVLEHPGSSAERLQKLFQGLYRQVFDVNEFIDRPQDVSYILDYLAQNFPKIVNVNQSGTIGHSFGGYTSLALAGAEIDFNYLKQECIQEINSANISLILQCEALKLRRQSYKFRDARIKFALAISPIDSSIFGPQGMAQIKIPVAIIASSDDVIASAVLEQIKPFSWIVYPEKYLVVVRGIGHIADIRDLISVFLPSLDNIIALEKIVPDTLSEPLKEYAATFILALVQTHVANQKDYQGYLQTAYALSSSESLNKVSIIRSLSPLEFKALL